MLFQVAQRVVAANCLLVPLSVCYIITWNAEGIHVLKPDWNLFFVGSHKCAYPTDIELISDRVDWFIFPTVLPNFPAPRRTPILPKPSQFFSASALDHSATVTHFRYLGVITKRAKLLNADWSMKRVLFLNFAWEEGKITRSRLVERQKFSLLIGWTYVFHIQLVSSVWAKQLRLHRSLSFNSRCIRRKGIKIKNWL